MIARPARSSSPLTSVKGGVRAFRLTLQPAPPRAGEGDRYGIQLEEAYADGERTLAATVATATPLQASRVLDALVASVRQPIDFAPPPQMVVFSLRGEHESQTA